MLLDDLHLFSRTEELPGGSWGAWLRKCSSTINHFHFRCTWEFVTGALVGMLVRLPGRFRLYRFLCGHLKSESDYRFRVMVVGIAMVLAGEPDNVIIELFPGDAGKALLRWCPRSILQWPLEYRPLIAKLTPLRLNIPCLNRANEDFFVNIMWGYYLTSQDPKAHEAIIRLYSQTTNPAKFPAFRAWKDALENSRTQ